MEEIDVPEELVDKVEECKQNDYGGCSRNR